MNNKARYSLAQRKMQSGVAAEMGIRDEPTEPKHLRVGVNTGLVEMAGLARLLVHKGYISEDEYWAALANEMEQEVLRYEERLTQHYGKKITLGAAGIV